MKYFENPTLEVVRIGQKNIIVTSLGVGTDITSSDGTINAGSADRFRDFDEY